VLHANRLKKSTSQTSHTGIEGREATAESKSPVKEPVGSQTHGASHSALSNGEVRKAPSKDVSSSAPKPVQLGLPKEPKTKRALNAMDVAVWAAAGALGLGPVGAGLGAACRVLLARTNGPSALVVVAAAAAGGSQMVLDKQPPP
ncbi:hypothetical protein CYMTET_32361, partial [Cymbomonas tetramitiformis]